MQVACGMEFSPFFSHQIFRFCISAFAPEEKERYRDAPEYARTRVPTYVDTLTESNFLEISFEFRSNVFTISSLH